MKVVNCYNLSIIIITNMQIQSHRPLLRLLITSILSSLAFNICLQKFECVTAQEVKGQLAWFYTFLLPSKYQKLNLIKSSTACQRSPFHPCCICQLNGSQTYIHSYIYICIYMYYFLTKFTFRVMFKVKIKNYVGEITKEQFSL